MDENQRYYLGRVEKNTIVLKQNSDSSINLLYVKENNTFSNRLKGRNYKITVGYFYRPADNPFSFGSGYFIAFQSTYIQEANSCTVIGVGMNGIIENKNVIYRER